MGLEAGSTRRRSAARPNPTLPASRPPPDQRPASPLRPRPLGTAATRGTGPYSEMGPNTSQRAALTTTRRHPPRHRVPDPSWFPSLGSRVMVPESWLPHQGPRGRTGAARGAWRTPAPSTGRPSLCPAPRQPREPAAVPTHDAPAIPSPRPPAPAPPTLGPAASPKPSTAPYRATAIGRRAAATGRSMRRERLDARLTRATSVVSPHAALA